MAKIIQIFIITCALSLAITKQNGNSKKQTQIVAGNNETLQQVRAPKVNHTSSSMVKDGTSQEVATSEDSRPSIPAEPSLVNASANIKPSISVGPFPENPTAGMKPPHENDTRNKKPLKPAQPASENAMTRKQEIARDRIYVFQKVQKYKGKFLLARLPVFGRAFEIKMEIKTMNISSIADVLHITTGGNHIPGIWLKRKDGKTRLAVHFPINEKYEWFYSDPLSWSEWYKIRLNQMQDGEHYVFRIYVDGKEIMKKPNKNPREPDNDVRVYAGAKYGKFRNLELIDLDYDWTEAKATFINNCERRIETFKLTETKLSDILGDRYIDELEGETRGVVRGSCGVWEASTTMKINTCFGKENFEIKKLVASPFEPVPWISFPPMQMLQLSFNYKDLGDRLNGTRIPKITLSGEGNLYFNDMILPYKLRRTYLDSDDTLIAGEVYIDISVGSLTSKKFMEIININRGLDDLYPSEGLRHLQHALEKFNPSDAIVSFTPAGRKNYFSVMLSDNAASQGLLSGMGIFCKKDLLYRKCVLIGKVTSQSPIMGLINGMDITDIVKKWNLFQNRRFPDKMIFQSSKDEIKDVSEIPFHEDIQYVTLNHGREDTNMSVGESVIPNTCFRYRYERMRKYYDVHINMCPTKNSLKFFFPDLVPLNVKDIINLIHGRGWTQNADLVKWLQQSKKELITIDYVSVSPSPTSSSGYTLMIRLKPRVENETVGQERGYKLVPNLAFTRIKESSIDIIIDDDTLQVKADGEEVFLGSKTQFVLKSEGGEEKITFQLKTPSNRVLMIGLKEKQVDIGLNEADLGGYITAFESLHNITLKNTKLDTNVLAYKFRITANAEIGDITGGKFQLQIQGTQTTSCFYKNIPLMIDTFLNTIHEGPFFDQSWMGCEGIGIMMSSSTVRSENRLCYNEEGSWGENEYFRQVSQIEYRRNNLIATLPELSADFFVTFEFYIKEESYPWVSILHMTTGKNSDVDGSRVPAVFFQQMKSGNIVDLLVCYQVNGNNSHCTRHPVPMKQWVSIRISQRYIDLDLKKANYTVVIDDSLVEEVTSTTAQRFENVKVYAADPFKHADKKGYIRNLVISRYPKKVGVIIRNIRFNKCGQTKGCTFLQRLFPYSYKITADLSGWMNGTNLALKGYTYEVINLGSVKIDAGVDGIEVVLRIKPKKDQGSVADNRVSIVSFEGPVRFGTHSQSYPGILTIGGDIIKFRIKETENREAPPNLYLYQRGFTSIFIKPKGRIPLSYDKPIETVEMRAPLYLTNGDNGDYPAIRIAKSSFISQSFDPNVPFNSKFYACKDSGRKILMKQLLLALNGGHLIGFLDGGYITNFCVAYHSDDEDWDVESIGKKFSKGLSITGTVETDFNSGGEKVYLPLNASVVEDGYLEMCVNLPVQKWRAPLPGKVKGEEEYLVEMYLGKGGRRESVGPRYCYRLPHPRGGDRVASSYMIGYLKTFAFEMEDARLNFESVPSGQESRLGNLQFILDDIKLFGEIFGKIELRSMTPKVDPAELRMQVKITLDLTPHQSDVYEALLYYCNKDKDIFSSQKNEFANYKKKLEKWIAEERSVIKNFESRVQSAGQRFQVASINRARAMNAFAKDCTRECGYVRIPSWKIDDECHKKIDGASMMCMKYNKDGGMASNVGCVGNCEAERVQSFVEAKHLHARTVVEGASIDQNVMCKLKGEKFVNKLEELKQVAAKHQEEARYEIRKIKAVKRDWRNLADSISNLIANTDSDMITDPRCLTFFFDFQGRSRRSQFCFNGFFRSLVPVFYDNTLYNKKRKEGISLKMEAIETRLRYICDKNTEDIDTRDILQLKKEFDDCAADNRKKGAKVGKSVRSLPALNTGHFTTFSASTLESFKKRSPWAVAKKRDNLTKLLHSEHKPVQQNLKLATNGSSCQTARRAIGDYHDIANYIHKWTKEHQSAKKLVADINEGIEKDRHLDMLSLFLNNKNYTEGEIKRMSYWINRTKDGLKEWATYEHEQMEHHNTESMPFIQRQLAYMYTDDKHKSLSDFFAQRSVEGNHAFKRANIETTSPDSFADLNKNLLSIVTNGTSLEKISDQINDVVERTEILHKRTIQCQP